MWSGAIADIPAGWTLCDGTDGTPDLTDRFVIGAGSTHAPGATGGEAEHTLTESELPAHDHDIRGSAGEADAPTFRTATTGDPVAGSTESTGGDEAHENRPPFYALAYIMRT